MSAARWLGVSERWFRLLLQLYPADFREEMGEALVETYRDRCRAALNRGGVPSLIGVWLRALGDSLRNGPGERLALANGNTPNQSGKVLPRAAIIRRSGDWGRDVALVMRRLARAPMFTATIIGTLTVGLGAFAVVYTAVYKVLIEPLPYERPDDLYFVWRDYGPIVDMTRGFLAGTDIVELDRTGGAIEGAVGLDVETMTLSARVGSEPEEVKVMESSPGLFDLLGVEPAFGRGFAPDEVGPGRTPVIVLGYDLWIRQFGADIAIVGSELLLDGERFTVIGVMERDFRFARHSTPGRAERADAYITFDFHLSETSPGNGSFAGLIRARAGTEPERVGAAVAAVGALVNERDFEGMGLRLYPLGVKSDLLSGVRPALVILGFAGAFLVVVLLLNLATLLLVRAVQREREFAVSRALGASGLTLARATLLEGGLLGALGGAGGAFAAVWGTDVMVALAPPNLPRLERIAVDGQIAAVMIGIGTLLGLIAAALPTFWGARTRLISLLSNAAVRGGGGHGRMRRGMVIVQVALSLVLLSAGSVVVRSFERLLHADPGFEPAGVLTLRVPVPRLRYPDGAAIRGLHTRIHAELAVLPGVAVVGAASTLPLLADADQTTVAFLGAPGNTGDREHDHPLIDYIRTRAGHVDALRIPILEGRLFDAAPAGERREVLIDRTLASTFFPSSSPLGATLAFRDDSLTVIGVVEHARLYDIHQDGRPQIYVRNDDYTTRTLSWVLRTDRGPLTLVPEVRTAIHRVDPQLALADVQSMDQVVGDSLRQQRLSAVLISGFSLGALLLAAMGLYGVVSGSVTRRRHELAVRLALGADHGRVIRLVLREGVLLIALGLLVGVPGIYFSGQAIRGVLVGVSPFDPLTLAAVACGLAIVALAACYVPTRRVARIDPARSLRDE